MRRNKCKYSSKELSIVHRRLITYLFDKGILTSGMSVKFNVVADMFLDYNNLTRPLGVSYRDMIHQIYKEGGLPQLEGYTLSSKKVPKEDKAEIKKERKAEYAKELEDSQWAALRLEILNRDGGRCQMCDTNKHLQVHHKRYISGKKAWEYPHNLLITVCRKCHSKHHGVHTNSKSK